MDLPQFEFRYIFNQWPGVTSLMSFGNLGLMLYAVRRIFYRQPVPLLMTLIAVAILFSATLRAMLNSERLALIEAAFAVAIPYAAFKWRPSIWRTLMPVIGLSLLFILFSVFEYYRSWQYYKNFTADLPTFLVSRFLSYFVTSINNGAGMMATIAPIGHPALSGAWLEKFPGLSSLGINWSAEDPVLGFLMRFGNPEFNNPGGMFVLTIDYGIPIGLSLMIVFGAFTGRIYRRFLHRDVFGLLLYPCWLVGVTDLLRIFYWTETRAFPLVVGAIAVAVGIAITLRHTATANSYNSGGIAKQSTKVNTLAIVELSQHMPIRIEST